MLIMLSLLCLCATFAQILAQPATINNDIQHVDNIFLNIFHEYTEDETNGRI